MLSLVFLAIALALFGLSYFLVRKTSAYSRTGGDAYVRRVRRKMIGMTLLFPAVLLMVLAISIEVASIPQSLPAAGVTTTEPYVPPVLPKPSEDDPLASREAPIQVSASSGVNHQRPSDDIPSLAAAALHSPEASAPDLPARPTTALPGASTTEASPEKLTAEEKSDADVDKFNAMLKTDPNNVDAYLGLGDIYTSRQAWAEAEANYDRALALNGSDARIKYSLAQMHFTQKSYDDARPGFVAIEKDSELGDLALFKTFLCDLYGGHEETAAKELDAFNQAGENASYYFANVAWSLYQKKPDDARSWLQSASHIYSPRKFALYTADMVKLGYLPLPPAQ